MRWLVALLLLVPAVARAEAFVADEEPGLYHLCPRGKTWDDVAKCIAKQGKLAVTRAIQGAKLVRLDQQEDGKEWVDAGVYLYVERQGAWKIAGAFFGRGTDYELIDLRPLVVGTHSGFQIEIGQTTQMWVQLDGITPSRALRRTMQTLYCGGHSNWCAHTIRSCEVLVHGGAYWTFRGSHTIQNNNEVAIVGDRRLAGPFCTQAERVFLGWPQQQP